MFTWYNFQKLILSYEKLLIVNSNFLFFSVPNYKTFDEKNNYAKKHKQSFPNVHLKTSKMHVQNIL